MMIQSAPQGQPRFISTMVEHNDLCRQFAEAFEVARRGWDDAVAAHHRFDQDGGHFVVPPFLLDQVFHVIQLAVN